MRDALSSAIRGTASEMEAALHFLEQGYAVFWPANQHTGIDMIVLCDSMLDRPLTVQVKTAHKRGKGWAVNLYSPNRVPLETHAVDLFAFVIPGERVVIEKAYRLPLKATTVRIK